jgi:nitrite reductase/ring-hydroxylating ferredoxin subunit
MQASKTFLCKLTSLPEPVSCKGFTLMSSAHIPVEIFLVRQQDKIYGYLNRCPHRGITLEWTPDQFLNFTQEVIQCGTHGAQFRIEDGYCIWGPCAGASLHKLPLVIDGDNVFLDKDINNLTQQDNQSSTLVSSTF